jgi:hypothetical protein
MIRATMRRHYRAVAYISHYGIALGAFEWLVPNYVPCTIRRWKGPADACVPSSVAWAGGTAQTGDIDRLLRKEGTGDAGQEKPAKAVGGSMQGGLEVWGHRGPCNIFSVLGLGDGLGYRSQRIPVL